MDTLIQALPTFFIGLVVGILLMAILNKVRSGAANPATAKKEFEAYQEQVEAHFEETSRKFHAMTNQYQDLYEHLAVGAVSLCRTENAVKLLDATEPTPALNKDAKQKSDTSKKGQTFEKKANVTANQTAKPMRAQDSSAATKAGELNKSSSAKT